MEKGLWQTHLPLFKRTNFSLIGALVERVQLEQSIKHGIHLSTLGQGLYNSLIWCHHPTLGQYRLRDMTCLVFIRMHGVLEGGGLGPF